MKDGANFAILIAMRIHQKSLHLTAWFKTGLAWFFLAYSSSAWSICYFNGKAQNGILSFNSNEPSKNQQIQIATADSQLFCEMNLSLRMININPVNASASGFRCQDSDEKSFTDIVNSTMLYDVRSFMSTIGGPAFQPWFSSLVPTQLAQNISVANVGDPSFFYSGFMQEQKGLTTFSQFAESYRNNILNTLTESFSKTPIDVFAPISKDDFFGSAYEKNNSAWQKSIAAQSAICSDFGITETVACVRALGRALEIVRPVFFQDMSYMPRAVWEKLLSNERFYSDGLRKASLKIISRLKNSKKSGGFILEDLVSSFQESGLPKADSLDAAYDVLALYGNGGANLGERLRRLSINSASSARRITRYCKPFENSVCGYLDIIGKAIPVLDYEYLRSGSYLYSLPKGSNSRCNNQKSYYFWLNAYLTRQLVKEGFEAKSAVLGAYALSIGYQFNRDQGVSSQPKLGANAFLFRSSFDPVYNIIRTDLASAYTGAIFGAENKITSLDENLLKLLRASNTSTSESYDPSSVLDQIKKYNRFKTTISPSSLFEK